MVSTYNVVQCIHNREKSNRYVNVMNIIEYIIYIELFPLHKKTVPYGKIFEMWNEIHIE